MSLIGFKDIRHSRVVLDLIKRAVSFLNMQVQI